MTAVCVALPLLACAGQAAAQGTLRVTAHDTAPAAVVDIARPAAIAFEQRVRERPIGDSDVMFERSLDVGTLAVVSYRYTHVMHGGARWCWVDAAHRSAGCSESGGFVLAEVLRMLAPATPLDADFVTLVSTLASGQLALPGARVERRRDGVRFAYALDTFDEARGKRVRIGERVWITPAGDVLVAEEHSSQGTVPARTALSFEGNRIGKGYVAPATLAPLRARSAEFDRCFANESDDYPFVGIDIVLDDHDRVARLAAWGTRVSIETTECVAALVRGTQFDRRADREARLAINRHAP